MPPSPMARRALAALLVSPPQALAPQPKKPNSRRNLDLAIGRLCAKMGDEPGHALRMRHGCVLIEGHWAKCSTEVARLCD